MTSGEHLFRSDIQVSGCRIYIKAPHEVQAQIAERYISDAMRKECEMFIRPRCVACNDTGAVEMRNGIRIPCPGCVKTECEGGD